MDANSYYKNFGLEESQRIASQIGVSWVHYRQYIYGRPPSIKYAWRMVWASRNKMTLEELLKPPKGEEASQYQ